jgi:hypothetical protein
VIREPNKRGQMEGRKTFEVNRQFRGGRSMRGRGGRWSEEVQQMNQNQQGNWGGGVGEGAIRKEEMLTNTGGQGNQKIFKGKISTGGNSLT